jgi:hypothetical protein
VLVSGTAGMSLATVIRMEFAYPGVGILAGDSIQYLSIATAHGVIMVFFMIMPAIFGAFGNFLLPTQLGVHDVAFPRLNSAAFWFLPGGLIMLCQLVCVDRRYQRMNCFNIRELQGILKRKFFTDLVNTSDSHKLSEPTLINMRHKSNMSTILLYDQSLFYNFDLTNTSKSKNFTFNPGKVYTYLGLNTGTRGVTDYTISKVNIISYYSVLSNVLKDFLSFLYLPGVPFSLTTILNIPHYTSSVFTNTLYLNIPSFNLDIIKNLLNLNSSKGTNTESKSTSYNTSNLNYSTFNSLSPSSFAENSSS